MAGTGRERSKHDPHRLGRYWRILQRPKQIWIDVEMHALLVAYASKHRLTLRDAGNKIVAAGLALELAQEDARKKRKEMEKLLK
jgi:hypothetical protein